MIAIIGAGIQGCAVAPELASRGLKVDLFDKSATPLSAASRWNEGKIHLGYIFAKDRSLASAKAMLSGAFTFFDFFERHLEQKFQSDSFSDPFLYAVHKDSMLTTAEVQAHLANVDDLMQSTSGRYFGEKNLRRCFRLKDIGNLNPELVSAVFQTPERSLDVKSFADKLSACVMQHPNISFHGSLQVTQISHESSGRYSLKQQNGHLLTGYTQIVNAAWQERLLLDAGLGIKPARSWMHRYKLAVHLSGASASETINSTTFVLAPLGDVVNFGNGHFYLSWYPVCRVGSSTELLPPLYEVEETQLLQIGQESLLQLRQIMPALQSLQIDWNTARIRGGYIFAWGAEDIDHESSALHKRYDIGVFSQGGYHSIDTGKYGMAARFALEAADRICAIAAQPRPTASSLAL